MPGWTLAVRAPDGRQQPLVLPEGASTGIAELIRAVGEASRVAAHRVVIKAGFPPRIVAGQGSQSNADDTVQSLALRDRDALTVLRAGSEDKMAVAAPPVNTPSVGPNSQIKRTAGAAAGTAVPSATQQAKPKKQRRVPKMPGKPRTLSEDPKEAHSQIPDATLNPLLEAQNGLAASLIDAMSEPGQGGWDPAARGLYASLRQSLTAARESREAEGVAEGKVAASLAGQTDFRELNDGSGRLEVSYMVGGAQLVECVPAIPRFLLAAVLGAVVGDGSDPVAQANVRPTAMAQVSPRMFWAVVRFGEVGPDRDFETALSGLAPSIHWKDRGISHRLKVANSKYADFELAASDSE